MLEAMAMVKRRDAPVDRMAEDSPLLLRRMMALGLDVSACARFEPATMADLHAVCRSCRKRGRCAIDLAKRADAPTELTKLERLLPQCGAARRAGVGQPTDWTAALRQSLGKDANMTLRSKPSRT